jgi:hypothetical protein
MSAIPDNPAAVASQASIAVRTGTNACRALASLPRKPQEAPLMQPIPPSPKDDNPLGLF